jgi:hypothetical protein
MSTAAGGKSPEILANEAVTDVLRTQWDGEPALRLDSPPGAGKTWVRAARPRGRDGSPERTPPYRESGD